MTRITLTRPLKIALIVLSGAFVGAGLLFLYMLRFTTYLGDDPSACVNCHIMQPYYATWDHSSHKNVTTCADCHMPYMAEGGVKFSDHHIQSPLAKMDRTCLVCHRESEETLRKNVEERQEKCLEVRGRLEDLLAKAHIEAKFAWDKGATEAEMKDALQDIRKSQWRWDYSVASHGASFHAPQEMLRLMGDGIDYAGQARLKIAKVLAKHGFTGEVPMPDLSTKAKAQAYIGLDMDGMREKKAKFMDNIVPQWLSMARENGKLLEY